MLFMSRMLNRINHAPLLLIFAFIVLVLISSVPLNVTHSAGDTPEPRDVQATQPILESTRPATQSATDAVTDTVTEAATQTPTIRPRNTRKYKPTFTPSNTPTATIPPPTLTPTPPPLTCDTALPSISTRLSTACSALEPENVCFASKVAAIDYVSVADFPKYPFTQIGNIIPVNLIRTVSTNHLNLIRGEWGLALIKTALDTPTSSETKTASL